MLKLHDLCFFLKKGKVGDSLGRVPEIYTNIYHLYMGYIMVVYRAPFLEFTECKKLNFKAGFFFGEKFLRRSPTGNEVTYPLPKSKLFDDFLRWDM